MNYSNSVEAMAKRLVRLHSASTDTERAAGIAWYGRATDTIDALAAEYGHDRATVANVTAVLSPQCPWARNVAGARLVLSADARGDGVETCWSATVYRANVVKAFRILRGDHSALHGPKVEAFGANLRGDLDYVTVDVWATRAAIGRDLPGRDRAAIVAAYKLAARRVGLSPAILQAIIWTHVRGSAD